MWECIFFYCYKLWVMCYYIFSIWNKDIQIKVEWVKYEDYEEVKILLSEQVIIYVVLLVFSKVVLEQC